MRAAVEDGGELVVGDVAPVEREGPQPVHRRNPERFPAGLIGGEAERPRAQLEAPELRTCPAGGLVDVAAADLGAVHKHEVL